VKAQRAAQSGKEGIMRRLRTFLFLAVTAVAATASLKPSTSEASEGFVLCSCQLCSQSDVICRISPSGFSTTCANYYATHCQP